MKPLATAAFAALGLALAGCTNDPNVVVTGTVTFDDQPVEAADLVVESSDRTGTPVGGKVVDGRYAIRIAPGSKRVAIYASKPVGPPDADGSVEMRSYIPTKYNRNTTLQIDVQPKGTNEFDFHLKSKG